MEGEIGGDLIRAVRVLSKGKLMKLNFHMTMQGHYGEPLKQKLSVEVYL